MCTYGICIHGNIHARARTHIHKCKKKGGKGGEGNDRKGWKESGGREAKECMQVVIIEAEK